MTAIEFCDLVSAWSNQLRGLMDRMIELDGKQQDSGLTPEEKVEFATIKEKARPLFAMMDHDLRGEQPAYIRIEKSRRPVSFSQVRLLNELESMDVVDSVEVFEITIDPMVTQLL